jgi:hypothetical protein
MTDGRRRLQVRLTLDSDMGSLFHWAAAIPERARARELVGLLRVGFAVGSGSAIPFHVASRDPGQRKVPLPAEARVSASNLNLELQAADETLGIFDATSVTGVPPL